MTLTTTTGAANANSYASVAEFDAYLLSILHVGAKASTATNQQKEAALASATRYMQGMAWAGTRAANDQALSWPRASVVVDGVAIPATVIPWQVRDGCCEFAYRLLLSDRAGDAVQGIKLTGMETQASTRQLVPPSVYDLLRPLLSSGGSGLSVVRA